MQDAQHLRIDLRTQYPEIDSVYTDDYLHIILSIPGISFESARDDKVGKALLWRRAFGVDVLCDSLRFICGEWVQIESELYKPNPNTINLCRSNTLAWEITQGPVLRSVVDKVDWSDALAIMQHHVVLIEYGISTILPMTSANSFHMIVDITQLGIFELPPLRIVQDIAMLLQEAYPERIEYIHIGPVSTPLVLLFELIKPLLTSRSRDKIKLVSKLPPLHRE